MIQKIKRILLLTALFLASITIEIFILKPFGIRINMELDNDTILVIIGCMAGVFLLSSTIVVCFNLIHDTTYTKDIAKNLAILWGINDIAFCVLFGMVYGREYFFIAMPTIVYVSFITYAFQLLCVWINNIYKEHKDLIDINNMLQNQHEQEVLSKKQHSRAKEDEKSNLHIFGESKESAISPNNLIYVESIGNYANVCYIENEKVCSRTLRTTLKQLKEELYEYKYIVQCHRAFLVNLYYVESLEGSNNRYSINLFSVDKQIPLSRIYKTMIKEALCASLQNRNPEVLMTNDHNDLTQDMSFPAGKGSSAI